MYQLKPQDAQFLYMESEHNLTHVTGLSIYDPSTVPGGEVVPYLAPHESRRLFGGAEGPVHTHTQEHWHRKRARARASTLALAFLPRARKSIRIPSAHARLPIVPLTADGERTVDSALQASELL